MRINKYLANIGLASRRGVDELIAQDRIKVNGELIQAGYKLVAGDVIECEGRSYPYKEETNDAPVYIALYKPTGISTTCAENDPENIIDYLFNEAQYIGDRKALAKFNELRLFPVGRLDKFSEGLIILTNDGALTHKLTHPSFEHEKEYHVELKNGIDDNFLKQFASGIEIELDDGSKQRTMPCTVTRINAREFKVILKQGLNRQIRRMADALGNPVSRLTRLRVAKLQLGSLRSGEFKLVTYDDII